MTAMWDRHTILDSSQRADVLDFIQRTETALGREAIDEARRRAVLHGWRGDHWICREDGRITGYALVQDGPVPSLEMVGGDLDDELRARALLVYPTLDWWHRNASTDAGEVVRRLLIMSASIPHESLPLPEGTAIRPFDVGTDETSWLRVNNESFASHPEQGAWRLDDLVARTHEPWFDPSGLLLLEKDGTLAASIWTRVHELYAERFGEVYVLSVAPAFQGQGLGRTMLSQGLDLLRRKGVTRVILFVDADNQGARALYTSMGFRDEREDRLLRFRAG
jgi:mycothiol synthase